MWSRPANGVVLSFLNPLNPLGPWIIFRDLGVTRDGPSLRTVQIYGHSNLEK